MPDRSSTKDRFRYGGSAIAQPAECREEQKTHAPKPGRSVGASHWKPARVLSCIMMLKSTQNRRSLSQRWELKKEIEFASVEK